MIIIIIIFLLNISSWPICRFIYIFRIDSSVTKKGGNYKYLLIEIKFVWLAVFSKRSRLLNTYDGGGEGNGT